MRKPFSLPIVFVLVLALSSVFAKDQPVWKSEQDFRNAVPMIHRQALWLEANPDAESWSDSLNTVLSWGRDVPYVKPDYSLPAMERLAGLLHSDALDEYIQAKLRK